MTWILSAVDTLALLFLILLFPIPLFWMLIHPAIRFWRRFGNRSFWMALPVWLVSGIVIVTLRGPLFASRFHRDGFTWLAGVSLLMVALWIDRQTRRVLGLRRLAGLPEMSPGRYPEGVVRAGIYGLIRHPRYLQYMLTLLSLGFLTGASGIFLLAIVSILLYQIVAPLEERELREHYGAHYESYARDVPRFLPRWGRRIQPRISP
jgi:protein-S-isoprenylcysteine O-methyltransferase Ste14